VGLARKPYKNIIVGFAAGGGTDLTARLIGQWLLERLGQPFIVKNRTGGVGNVAAEMVVHMRLPTVTRCCSLTPRMPLTRPFMTTSISTSSVVDPKIISRLADLGGAAFAGSPDTFGKLIAEETEKCAKVVKVPGAKPDNNLHSLND
jgi:hypothetical protein